MKRTQTLIEAKSLLDALRKVETTLAKTQSANIDPTATPGIFRVTVWGPKR